VTRGADGSVSLVLPDLSGGGAERVMLQVAGGLARDGREVRLVLGKARGPLARQLPAGVVVDELGRAHVREMVPGLVRHLRAHRPSCLVSTLDHTNVTALVARGLARTRTPVVVRVANTMTEVARQPGQRRDRATVQVARRVYPWADALVAPSAGVAADVVELVRPRCLPHLHVIPNPVIGPDLTTRAQSPSGHPWLDGDGGPPVVLAVGSLTAKKNHGLVVRAVARVRRHRPVRLVVLGGGPERGALLAEATRLGLAPGTDVDLPGWVDDPFPHLARCAVFVLGSDREGLPGALIQAVACGARVVATDCRSGPREVLDEGRVGRLVPVGDVDAMAAALTAALDEHDRAVPHAGGPDAVARYTEAASVAAYGRLVDDLDRANRGGRRAF
jgi:glycosyltransferase involved in cell wall biosynthesis